MNLNQNMNQIKVLSYQPSCVAITARNRNLAIAASDGISPVAEYLSMEEIEYLNDHSPVFKLGMLEFEDSIRDELYERLHIDPQKCLFEREIDALLQKADRESLAKIIDISDILTIGRVRGHMARLRAFVPASVADVVNYRYNEIRAGQRKSKIAVEQLPKNEPDVRDAKMDAMQQELTAMREQMAALLERLAMTQAPAEPAVEETPVEGKARRNRGRARESDNAE